MFFWHNYQPNQTNKVNDFTKSLCHWRSDSRKKRKILCLQKCVGGLIRCCSIHLKEMDHINKETTMNMIISMIFFGKMCFLVLCRRSLIFTTNVKNVVAKHVNRVLFFVIALNFFGSSWRGIQIAQLDVCFNFDIED